MGTLLLAEVRFTSGFTLVLYNSESFDKCIMSRIHHCRIIQHSFAALKIPLPVPALHPRHIYYLIYLDIFLQGAFENYVSNTTQLMQYFPFPVRV